ncbi:BPI fold-containing family B member 4-like [Oxyura jamaicensis]|uniref:BPI fold-containing family B member 4-like n=1 Tax=Oxyura jamaicensis TaxID=8884 RepID=UPI0015A63F49|nr:BPI fold-containing family B member 4-like [Oxyura jamaicensis]XP_035200010.1 BPI fold-containing family B member 4-like [Oxyura jamaicensis]XP_035200011.1 BPI fold-containing family B member 4-like [Oxyura jamaicensis]XP_035200012.1 BPI fold-containing family B member 4-like [Oxyura jamaicensis]XP_035200014.1 BPI fold-containing family B member 4-like [Oxyura jamaicensis]XP_035200015.1 BPI fold-containing family B member 4-like [Oxyura jamaicensis]XP_035200016.1 BPI fold-containing family
MKLLKLFGIVFFCGLLSPSRGVLSGLSCAVSPGAMQKVLSDAVIQNGLLQKHLQGLVLPNIMGEGGLLNSPTSITGLHLVQVRLPKLSVVLLPGIGVQLAISARLDLSGNCLVGLLSELIDISVDVTVTANIKCTNFELGAVQVVIDDCFCILGAVKIKLLSGLLSLSVNDIVLNQLTATLPGLLCPVIDIIVNLVNIQFLGTLNAVIPVGTVGTIHYQLASLPFTSGLSLGLDLDGAVQQVGGSIIPHDSSASALPPLHDRLLVLGLRQSFLNAILSLLIQVKPQTFICSPEAFSGAKQLQEAILTLFPSGCSSCSVTAPLSIRIELFGKPLILLENNKATVELSAMILVFVKRLDGSILNLLLLKADLSLNVHMSISGSSLVLALSLGSTSLSLESSDVGISDISSLKPHCSQLLVEMLLPLINGCLGTGIPLPNVLGIPLVKVDIQILLGLLVILV